ncbi:MAG: hypothetical protein L0Y71_04925 [Gemmataceae bacterium]|nr:hypothetical protein [Gemmataceae bacterium]
MAVCVQWCSAMQCNRLVRGRYGLRPILTPDDDWRSPARGRAAAATSM